MKWGEVSKLPAGKFRRLTGVKLKTFDRMVEILRPAHKVKKKRGGRPNKLCIEDMLLMTLEYIREYRTYFHIGQSYGVSESTSYKTVVWVEDTLIAHRDFSLPGKKSLLELNGAQDMVLIDVTESPIQRPKKSNGSIIQGKRKNTRLKVKS